VSFTLLRPAHPAVIIVAAAAAASSAKRTGVLRGEPESVIIRGAIASAPLNAK
jgi:hypothetical protein